MAFSSEKKVGFFFILALLIFAVMLEVGEKWNPFEIKITYKTYLASITGLKVGDSVRLAGVDVGKIDDISVLENKVEINFEVKKGTRIKTDTVASVRMNSLLGGQFLGLSFGSTGAALLPPGSVVRGKETANIDQIVENVGDLTKDAKVLITDLNKNQSEVIGKISTMLDENRANLHNTIANLDSITSKFDRGEGSLGLLLNDKRLYNNTNEVTANLKSITGKINRGEGTIGKLVNDDAFYNDAKVAMKDFKDITGKINKGQGTVGKLINDDSLYGEFKDATKNVKEITQKINTGQGTLGKLVNDDKLYYDAPATLKKTEKAVEGLGDTGPISVLGSVVGTLF